MLRVMFSDLGQESIFAEVFCCDFECLFGTFGKVVRVPLYREFEGGITAWNVRSRNWDDI
jgi:hypothetical protein